MPETRDDAIELTLYGSKGCGDTLRTEARLTQLGVPYQFVDIDRDMDARDTVMLWNSGRPKTPTIVFGSSDQPGLVEPTNEQLDAMLREHGILATMR